MWSKKQPYTQHIHNTRLSSNGALALPKVNSEYSMSMTVLNYWIAYPHKFQRLKVMCSSRESANISSVLSIF